MSPHERTPVRRPRGIRGVVVFLAAGALLLPGCSEDGEAGSDAEADTAAATAGGEAPPLATDTAGLDPEVRRDMQEFRQVGERLTQLQQQALEDPEIQESQEELRQRVESVVQEIDPEADQKVARLEEIQGELQQVQGGGQAAMDSLRPVLMEAQRLQQSLQQARMQAMEREGLQEALEEFREDLVARMNEIDPQADSLLALAESLSARLQEAQSGAMTPPGPPGEGPDGGGEGETPPRDG